LKGILGTEADSPRLAVIQTNQRKNCRVMEVGDSICEWRLSGIFKNRVVFLKQDRIRILFLGRTGIDHSAGFPKKKPDGSGIFNSEAKNQENRTEASDFQRTLKRKTLETRLREEWKQIRENIRCLPCLGKYGDVGLKIHGLPASSIFSDLGLRNNDLIKEVNDVRIKSLHTLFSFYSSLTRPGTFRLVLERDGKNLTYTFRLK
jgi:type II secretory pathway component PulC